MTMNDKTILAGILLNETTMISFIEVCQQTNLSEHELTELLDLGLLEPQETDYAQMTFSASMIQRVQVAHRLQRDLKLNPQAAVLVLELLDEMNQLRQELAILRRHLDFKA